MAWNQPGKGSQDPWRGKGPGGGKVSLAMDMASIYWANSVDGAVMVMHKP